MSTPQTPMLIGTGTESDYLPVNEDNPVPVESAVPTAVYSAQATVGTSAAALSAQALTAGVVALKADDDNAGSVYVGPSGVTTSNGYRLKAGQSVPVNIDNLSKIYAIASQASQKLHVVGS